MKALVAKRYGGPDVLAVIDRPEPEVGPRDVLIAVQAASLNPIDFKIRDGKVKLVLPLPPPIALGCDVAGVVERVGAGVTRFRAGDEVFARLEKGRMGGLAERAAAIEAGGVRRARARPRPRQDRRDDLIAPCPAPQARSSPRTSCDHHVLPVTTTHAGWSPTHAR